MAAFKLDQVQADAILDIRLYQLARLEIEKILAERAEKKKRLKEIEAPPRPPARALEDDPRRARRPGREVRRQAAQRSFSAGEELA